MESSQARARAGETPRETPRDLRCVNCGDMYFAPLRVPLTPRDGQAIGRSTTRRDGPLGPWLAQTSRGQLFGGANHDGERFNSIPVWKSNRMCTTQKIAPATRAGAN